MHSNFMKRAIELAVNNVQSNKGGPFGAVIVYNNDIIAQGVNLVTATNDPTAHAEMVAIRVACKKLNSFQLTNCTLYSSCEPCPMCIGAIYWARPDALYFASAQQDAAAIGFDDHFIYEELALAYEKRRIPTTQIMRAEAQEPFELWRRSHNKIAY